MRHDLRVLGLDHPRRALRDTARYRPLREPGRTGVPSLRSLALRLLGRAVQVACGVRVSE